MTQHGSSKQLENSAKRPYRKPELTCLDADQTATGPATFTQEVLIYYTPPS
ncbi:hypothetical protein [Parerythrobacter aestuarii]|uniref:hypothetical protein n=1 Tax=Parerythrobacter aestuarii TaxID=3020909 RepID=UPI0024DE0C80|nr:hypothetical protein [Parerythrobacter aestuarii]